MREEKQYCVMFYNPTRFVQECNLLGSNLFLLKKNFGNPEKVIIGNLHGGEYSHILTEIMNNTHKYNVDFLRIYSDSLANYGKGKKLRVISSDGSGFIHSRPIDLNEILKKQKENGAVQDTILDIDMKEHKAHLDGNLFFKFNIEPKSRLHFSIFLSKLK